MKEWDGGDKLSVFEISGLMGSEEWSEMAWVVEAGSSSARSMWRQSRQILDTLLELVHRTDLWNDLPAPQRSQELIAVLDIKSERYVKLSSFRIS